MFEDKDLIVNRTETKLLYDIRNLLIEQNELLKSVVSHENTKVDTDTPKPENNTISLDGLKRHEILARVKELPNKPNKWSLLSNEELKALIKKGENK